MNNLSQKQLEDIPTYVIKTKDDKGLIHIRETDDQVKILCKDFSITTANNFTTFVTNETIHFSKFHFFPDQTIFNGYKLFTINNPPRGIEAIPMFMDQRLAAYQLVRGSIQCLYDNQPTFQLIFAIDDTFKMLWVHRNLYLVVQGDNTIGVTNDINLATPFLAYTNTFSTCSY